MQPTFSIIIPVYNLGAMVCDAIESCIRQHGVDGKDLEIIVINDGSTDDSGKYIDLYKHIENIVIVHQQNQGLSATRNNGIRMAKGQYILFLDGDDWLAPNALSSLYPYLGESLLVFPMIYHYGQIRQEVRRYGLEERKYNCDEFLYNTLGHKQFNIIPAQNKCYCRETLLSRDIQFITGILHEDNPFFIKAVYGFPNIRYIDAPIYYYRQNRTGSITSSCSIKNFNGVMVGNREITNITQNKNKDVNFLLGNLHVFQVIGNYRKAEDQRVVFQYYRQISTKRMLLFLLLHSRFHIKHYVRTVLLLLDPKVLNGVIKML
mgnify:CR=1 FL=1